MDNIWLIYKRALHGISKRSQFGRGYYIQKVLQLACSWGAVLQDPRYHSLGCLNRLWAMEELMIPTSVLVESDILALDGLHKPLRGGEARALVQVPYKQSCASDALTEVWMRTDKHAWQRKYHAQRRSAVKACSTMLPTF